MPDGQTDFQKIESEEYKLYVKNVELKKKLKQMEKEVMKLTMLKNGGAEFNNHRKTGNMYLDKGLDQSSILMIKESGMNLDLSDRYE